MLGDFLFKGNDIPWYRIRGEMVVIDEDLAKVFSVTTRALNQYAKRRFWFGQITNFTLEPDEMYSIYFTEGQRGNEKRNRRYPYTVYTKRAVNLLAGHYGRKRVRPFS